jgi:hypothetical protein
MLTTESRHSPVRDIDMAKVAHEGAALLRRALAPIATPDRLFRLLGEIREVEPWVQEAARRNQDAGELARLRDLLGEALLVTSQLTDLPATA